MDDSPSPHLPRLCWREGSLQRILIGTATGIAAGSTYAVTRSFPPGNILRIGMTCGFVAAPFFAIREALLANVQVDGPVASAFAGGFIGYFGALALSGPNWKVISNSTMVMGVSCGLVDAVLTGLDWQRKVYLVEKRQNQVDMNHSSQQHGIIMHDRNDQSNEQIPQIQNDNQRKPKWWKWSDYVTPLKDVDQEYRDLLRSQKATVIALKQEQARIAVLLRALESVKAGNVVTDIQLQHANPVSSFMNDEGDEEDLVYRLEPDLTTKPKPKR